MLYLLIALAVLQVLYWWYAYRPFREEESAASSDMPGVSIVIAARNEAATISQLLHNLALQEYPLYEVIVVDDRSSDDTATLVRAINTELSITLVEVTEDRPGKKLALQKAISVASYSWILATDADCVPSSSRWVDAMMARRGDHVAVIGYGPLCASSTVASWLAAGEAAWTATHYLSAASKGRPYMAVGRNWLFSKAAYQQVGGYAGHADIASGDDDLLLQDLATVGTIGWTTATASHVESSAAATWTSWLRQKSRHLSTASNYTQRSQRDLVIFGVSHIMGVIAGFASFFFVAWPVVLTVLIVKWSLQMAITYPWYLRLGKLGYWRLLPIMEVCLAAFYLIVSPYLWWRKTTW